MSYRLSRNVIVSIILLGVVLVSFLIASAFWEKERVEAVPGWDTNVLESSYVAWFSSFERGCFVNTEYKPPVLLFITTTRSNLHGYEFFPEIHAIIWEDGTIVWRESNELRNFAVDTDSIDNGNNEQNIEVSMSRIDGDKVKELLRALDDSFVWNAEFYGRMVSGVTDARLTIRSGGEERTIKLDNIDVPNLFYSLLNFGISGLYGAMEWRRVTSMIFSMIPSDNRRVTMSYKTCDCDSPFCWIGIIEIPKELPDGSGL